MSDLTSQQLSLALGLALGLAFGVLAERSAFCFRSALVGAEPRRSMGLWMLALAVAILATQGAVAAGLLDFGGHRFLAPDLPLLAVLGGGLMFGAGMVLTRGCLSRLLIVGAAGNLRALATFLLAAIVAHAAQKGVLAPLRLAIVEITWPVGEAADLGRLPGGPLAWTLLLAGAALLLALRGRIGARLAALGVLIGLLVPAGWLGTGWLLADEMAPLPLESLSFVGPSADSLFWFIAATSIPAGFGVGLIGGTAAGAFASSLAAGSRQRASFESPAQMLRYGAGAALMGFGGVLAGGCTIGAGLSGIPLLSLSAVLTLAAITTGALATNAAVNHGALGA